MRLKLEFFSISIFFLGVAFALVSSLGAYETGACLEGPKCGTDGGCALVRDYLCFDVEKLVGFEDWNEEGF